MKKAIIGVSGGVAFGINIPKGITVEIRDYDVDGSEHPDMVRDLEGDLFIPILLTNED